MHILIIPSEEFVPENVPLAGIFQYHQAMILYQKGHKVGVVSIRLSFSMPMLVKALILKIFGRKANNATDNYSVSEVLKLGYRKLFRLNHFIEKEDKQGVQVFRIDGFFYKKPADNENHFGWIKAGLAAFKAYVKHYGKPDIIHAHNAIYAGMLAHKIYIKYGVPYILTEHSTIFGQGNLKGKKLIERIGNAYRKSGSLHAVSEPFCQLLNTSFPPARFTCLPNVLDSYLEKQEFNAEYLQKDEFVFLNIGELHPKKDHFTLLQAFEKILAKYPRTKLWIGGNGELAGELQIFTQKKQLEDRVTFLGLLDRQQVINYIKKSHCFVLSSKVETFGVVVIEAMLFGKPVVVTRCGGPEGFVTKSTGIIVEKENSDRLAEAMEIIIEDYMQYQPKAIRQFAIDQFGSEAFYKKIEGVYEEAMRNHYLN